MHAGKYIDILTVASVFAFSSVVVRAQTSLNVFYRNETQILELNYQPTEKVNLPVSNIEIMDARFDQTKIGTKTVNALQEIKTLDLIFEDNLSTYLTKKFQQWFSFDSSSTDKMILLIKDFRLSEDISEFVSKSMRKEKLFYLSCAVYIQRADSCYKIDLISKWESERNKINDKKLCKEAHENFVTNVLLYDISHLNFAIKSDNEVYARNEIDKQLKKRFEVPALNEEIRKGIFKTFEDFLKNKPADISFSRKIDKHGKAMLFDSSGKIINAQNAWGMCTGEQVFYFVNEHYYELKRRAGFFEVKTFYTTGDRTIFMLDDLYKLAYISNGSRRAFTLKNVPAFIEVNMDTGELYLEGLAGISGPQILLQQTD